MGECPVSIFGTLIGHHSDLVKPNRDSTQTIQQFIHENGSNYSPIKWMITVADIKKKRKNNFNSIWSGRHDDDEFFFSIGK